MFKFVSTKNINELFQRAILHNDIQRTRLILEEAMKDPRFNIDQINEEGLTALQYSCFAGNLEIVKILAAYGANWKIRDRDGYTLMHASAMAGNGPVMRFLLQLGLKPTLKTDDGMMPIDLTDEISIIVILLRSMLDQGFLQEMQDYMMDHPKLKRNIFKELEKVKCREQEKVELLNEMPYTSHPVPRPKTLDKPKKSKSGARRSTSTFSELSDSIQQLDKVEAGFTDLNNNECDVNDSYPCPRSNVYLRVSEPDTDTLKRENSFSSSSSHGSKSSHRSGCGPGGILRHSNRQEHNGDTDHAYRNTQQYLESRFPAVCSRPKSVTFDVDSELMNNRKYSDCPPSNNYDENYIQQSQCSVKTNPIDLKPVPAFDEPLYENASSARMRAKISNPQNPSKIHMQISDKQLPPPLPPRAPTTQLSEGLRLNHVSYNTTNNRTYEENYISDRQLGSETDSGIDVNETAGRVFALSVNDRRDEDTYSRSSMHHGENYSKPIGLYYSEQLKGPLARQHLPDKQEPPCSFAIRKNYDNSKYRSWNGRSFHEAELTPYNSHYRKSQTNENFYETRYSRNPSDPSGVKVAGSTPNISEGNYQTESVRKDIEPIDFSTFDFDNQPEIML